MPWTNQAVNLIILDESATGFSGLFGYSPVPGKGNLAFSVAAAPGTDPYGNSYQAGLTTYGTFAGLPVSIVLNDGIIAFSNGTQIIGDPSSGLLELAGSPGTNAISTSLPVTPLAAIRPGTTVTPESWHQPVTTGFAAVAGVQPVEYRLSADGMVDITGFMQASAAYASGTAIWTMPAGYLPAATATIPVTIFLSGTYSQAWAQITSTGVVSISAAVGSGATVTFSGRYRLAA